MASFTMKVGQMDLAPYVRAQPGEGFDPADSGGYAQPGFIDTPYFEGQQLSSVNVENRKMTVPLAMSPWTTPPTVYTNLVTNPSFEGGTTTGWQLGSSGTWHAGAATSIAVVAGGVTGSNAMRTTCPASAGTGSEISIPGSFVFGSQLYISFWAKLNSGTGTLTCRLADASSNGPLGSLNFTVTGSWQRFTLACTASNGTCADVWLEFYNQTAAAVSFDIDAVSVVQGATDVGYFDGNTVGAMWTGASNASTSTSPADYTNLVTNPNLETDTSGWLATGSFMTAGATLSRTTTQAREGTASLQVQTAAVAAQGAYIPASVQGGVQYTASFYAKGAVGGEQLDLVFGDSNAFDFTEISNPAPLTTSWQRYSITFTPKSDYSTPSSMGLNIRTGSATAMLFYIDSVQITRGSSAPAYFDGDSKGAVWNGIQRNSTSTTVSGKNGVHRLIQQINKALGAFPPPQVEWKDTGASNSSFTSLIYGRLDVDFNYWRAASNWEFGTLHLYVQPYADTGTTRIVATAAGSGAIITVPIPSIGGDVAPLLDIRMAEGSYYTPQGRMLGVAALPHASYTVRVPVASFLQLSGATVVGASGADGSQALGVVQAASAWNPWSFIAALSPGSVYAGKRHRVLMPARKAHQGMTALRADYGGQAIGPTSLATAADWALTDLGVLSVPSNPPATIAIRVRGAFGGYSKGNPMPPIFMDGPAGAQAATHYVQLGPVLVLPESNSTFIFDTQALPLALELSANAASVNDLRTRSDNLGNPWATSALAGAGGFTQFDNSQWDGDVLVPNWTTGQAAGRARSEHTPVADLQMELNVKIPRATDSVGLFKEMAPSMMIEGLYRGFGVSSSMLSITLFEPQGGTQLLASVGFAGAHATTGHKLTMRFQGPAITLNLDPNDIVNIATVGASLVASHALAQYTGKAGLTMIASQGFVSVSPNVRGFRVTALPSQAQGASDMYEIDQIGQTVARTSGVNVDSLPERVRGRVQAVPSTVALAILSTSIDKGPMNDLLQVDIRVRERFLYAR